MLGRRSWPNGRAALGALLVVAAGLGVYIAHRQATAEPDTRWLVAVRTIDAGQQVSADDLGLASMRLAEGTGGVAFASPDEVVGSRALERIGEGELVQRSDLATPSLDAGDARRVTLALPAGRALAGEIVEGQVVDLLATHDLEGSTTVVARDALVTAVRASGAASIGSTEEVRVTLVLPDEASAVAVVDAHETGRVTVVASTSFELDGAAEEDGDA